MSTKKCSPENPARTEETRRSNFNWVSQKLGVKQCALGRGQIALTPFACGEAIAVFGGRVMTIGKCDQLPPDIQEMAMQVSDSPELLCGPMHPDEVSNGDFFNHSGNPNAGLRGDLRLIAMRDIAAGEAITFDYAICMADVGWRMACECGEANCRKQVTGDDWMIAELQHKYVGYWMSFIQEKIDTQHALRNKT